MKKVIILGNIFLGLFFFVSAGYAADNIIKNGHFEKDGYYKGSSYYCKKNTSDWIWLGKVCKDNPGRCIYNASDLVCWDTYTIKCRYTADFKAHFGKRNATQGIAQIVYVPQEAKTLKLKYWLKMKNKKKKGIKKDKFKVLISDINLTKAYKRKKTTYYQFKKKKGGFKGYKRYKMNLTKQLPEIRGQFIIVYFFMKNNNKYKTESFLDDITMKAGY